VQRVQKIISREARRCYVLFGQVSKPCGPECISIGCSISEGLTVTDNRIWYLASYREIIEL